MKITLTKRELLDMLYDKFGFKFSEVDIVPDTDNDISAAKCQQAVEIPLSKGKKIDAIKALREVAGNTNVTGLSECRLGLADAKWAVENWPKWIEFVRNFGRLPQAGYHLTGSLR